MQKEKYTSNVFAMECKDEIKAVKSLDTTGKLCPDLIIDINRMIHTLNVGEVIEIIATDSAVKSCIPSWCKDTGHVLLESHFDTKNYKYYYLVKRVRKSF